MRWSKAGIAVALARFFAGVFFVGCFAPGFVVDFVVDFALVTLRAALRAAAVPPSD